MVSSPPAAASAGAVKEQSRKRVPVGVLVYAVIEDWGKDPDATAAMLANMGFQGLEITNYMSQWTRKSQGISGNDGCPQFEMLRQSHGTWVFCPAKT